MMGWRIREFVRNLFAGRELEKKLRPGRRRPATSLRLESLEDRTVTSTMDVVPVVLLAPANTPPSQSASTQTATLSTQAQAVTSSVSVDAAFDALYENAMGVPGASYGNSLQFQVQITLSSNSAATSIVASASVGLPNGSVNVNFDADVTGHLGSHRDVTSSASGSVQTHSPAESTVSAPGVSSTAESTVGSPAHTSASRAVAAPANGVPGPSSAPIVSSILPQSRAAGITDNQVQVGWSSANGNVPLAHVRSTNGTTVQFDTLPQSQPANVGSSEMPPARADRDAGPLNGTLLSADDQADGSLLRRYVKNQEQAAFTALVQRHERFVLGICRRVLGNSHAAEDAFQATFLVLARRAGAMEWRGPLTGWLYKVAYHLSLRVRAVNARQKLAEKLASAEQLPQQSDNFVNDLEREEVRVVVNEELERMPEKYRLPLVLCFLGGLTHEQAANQMGLPRGSMAKRISEALKQLRRRLLNRGLSL